MLLIFDDNMSGFHVSSQIRQANIRNAMSYLYQRIRVCSSPRMWKETWNFLKEIKSVFVPKIIRVDSQAPPLHTQAPKWYCKRSSISPTIPLPHRLISNSRESVVRWPRSTKIFSRSWNESTWTAIVRRTFRTPPNIPVPLHPIHNLHLKDITVIFTEGVPTESAVRGSVSSQLTFFGQHVAAAAFIRPSIRWGSSVWVLRAVVVEFCSAELAVLYECIHSKFCFLFALVTLFQSDGGVTLEIVPVRAHHGEGFRRGLLGLRRWREWVNGVLRGDVTKWWNDNSFILKTNCDIWEGATLKSRSGTGWAQWHLK